VTTLRGKSKPILKIRFLFRRFAISDIALRLLDERYSSSTRTAQHNQVLWRLKAVEDISFLLHQAAFTASSGLTGPGRQLRSDDFGHHQAQPGTISILGHATALEVRHRIGYLPEEKGLYKKMRRGLSLHILRL